MLKARMIAFLLAAATSLAAHNNGALAETRPCHSMEYERNAYTICEVDLRKNTVRLYWKRSDGAPYAYLSALPRALEGEAGRLLFATNAGMFDPALKPVGLYVEQGRELVHVNTKSGYGNFHMKPNGVFYISVDRAAVAETRAFLKQRPQAELATQSQYPLTDPRQFDILQIRPWLTGTGMQFDQIKRREFITLLGGVTDTRPSRFAPRRSRSPQGLYVLLARRSLR